MNTLRLYGNLGKKFGKVHRYAANSISSSLRLLMANYPEMRNILLYRDPNNLYKVSVDTESYDITKFNEPLNNATIRIVPIIEGAGNDDNIKIIGGALLFAAAMWMTAGMAAGVVGSAQMGIAGAMGSLAAPIVSMAGNVGMSLLFAGVASLLYKPPPTPPENTGRGFDGAINTTRQGLPVPIGYGRCLVGSAVISAGIINTTVPI